MRGVAQAVIAWWYADNLLWVWLGLAGLGAVFYFVPKLRGVELHSHYLALLTFWMLILFASWGGIPSTAPVPAWMPAASTVATVLTLVPVIAVGLNVFRTARRPGTALATRALLHAFGDGGFVLAGLMRIAGAVLDCHQSAPLHLVFLRADPAQFYGFFVMVMFGAIYYILPLVTGVEFPYPKLVSAHFWLGAWALCCCVVPLAIGGVVQALPVG